MIILEHLYNKKNYKKIIFLDRDGVINVNRERYVRSKDDVEIINGVREAFINFNNCNVGVIIVTNQQVIGKKILSAEEAIGIHLEVIKRIQLDDNSIIASFMCPHLVSEKCECRKPNNKMLITASKLYDIDMSDNCFIGDAITDIEVAKRTGIQPLFIRGTIKNGLVNNEIISFNNLLEASDYVCTNLHRDN